MIQVSKAQARRFLLSKQLLYPAGALHGKHAVETVFNTLRVIQYDPLNPCGRNTDLVLQARISDYHPNDYYQWLYKERKGIECYDKELCIIPVEDLPLTSYLRARKHQHVAIHDFVKNHERELEQLMQYIETNGLITTTTFKDSRKTNIFWNNTPWSRAAIETLWKLGRLVVVKRENGRKYYDLPKRVYKTSLQFPDYSQAVEREHVIRRLTSVGILPKVRSVEGWQGVGPAADISKIIHQLLEEGVFSLVHVEGVSQEYVINSQGVDLIKKIKPLKNPRMVFIAPLDTFMWDRLMIEHIFDFRYRWEVYTPVAKREFGYYVLPILYGDEIVGRIEPVLTRENTLEIKGFWPREELWTKNTKAAFEKALENFRDYLKAYTITWSSTTPRP